MNSTQVVISSLYDATCHTLAVAGTTATIGLNLDATPLNSAGVLEVIENGGRGSGGVPPGSGGMPPGTRQGQEASRSPSSWPGSTWR